MDHVSLAPSFLHSGAGKIHHLLHTTVLGLLGAVRSSTEGTDRDISVCCTFGVRLDTALCGSGRGAHPGVAGACRGCGYALESRVRTDAAWAGGVAGTGRGQGPEEILTSRLHRQKRCVRMSLPPSLARRDGRTTLCFQALLRPGSESYHGCLLCH